MSYEGKPFPKGVVWFEPDPFHGNPGNTRRILMLNYSIDGLNWFQAGCVAMSKNPLESFHYSSQVVVGDDLLVLSRTSLGGDNNLADYTWQSGIAEGKAKLPYNNHDTNMITLHRVRNFRSLALDLKPDYSYSAAIDAMDELKSGTQRTAATSETPR